MSVKKLEEMFALQERLNIETNGKEWKNGVSKNGKTINWTRCIYMECCEAIDSFPWKHWRIFLLILIGKISRQKLLIYGTFL